MSGGNGAHPAENAQALLFARDLAKLNTLRRAYERLVPAPVDTEEPTATVREATALFTDLRHFTQRLWSWRSEFGNDRHWSEQLGNAVIARGAETFWADLTRRGDAAAAAVSTETTT